MRPLTTPDDLDALLQAPVAILLKHGARCPVSAAARDALMAFEEGDPGIPVAGIEVTGERALSDAIAERTGIRHESPQVMVLVHGAPRWTATKRDISAESIAGALAEVRAS